MFHVKQSLEKYQELLHKWQKTINLVSNSTLQDSWNRHFEDSLQVLPYIPQGINNLVDIGSGAGFPGLVVAMARPDIKVSLIESDGKKCSFMKSVSRETLCPVTVICERIENTDLDIVPDMISARALASLDKLFGLCEKWIIENPKIQLLFLKGQTFQDEIDQCQKSWNFDYDIHPSKTDDNGVVMLISNISKK